MNRTCKLATAAAFSLVVAGLALSGLFSFPTALAMGSDAPADSVTALPGYKSAEALIAEKKYAEAITELNALNKPDDANVLNLLGYTHRMSGKVDEGIAFYIKALEKDSNHKGAYEYLGEAYLMKNDLANAEATYVKLKDLCGYFGCDEEKELAAEIDAYKKKQGS
ncbi:MAG: tetratricopeptide repeat protein [Parvibaculaceae bacterium]